MTTTAHTFNQLHEAIKLAQRVLLVAHKKPDGDTLGSSSSVLNWLLREGKDVQAFCADIPPSPFRYLDQVERYTNDPALFDDAYDIVIIFDSGDMRYCGVAEHMPRLQPGYLLVNIDHHNTNEHFGHLNLVHLDASSTAEVIHRFYEINNIFIDPRMATSLLTGLLTDTSHFSNAGTTPGSIDAAGKMFAAGARHQDIARHLLNNKTVDSLKLWGLALARLHENSKLGIITTYLLKNDLPDISSDAVEGISNFLNAVVNQADTILVLRELSNGEIKGSMRSVNRDISKLAKLLGGGGHKKAAGFTVRGRIEEASTGPRIVAS